MNQYGMRYFKLPSLDDIIKHRVIVVTLSMAMYLTSLGLPKGITIIKLKYQHLLVMNSDIWIPSSFLPFCCVIKLFCYLLFYHSFYFLIRQHLSYDIPTTKFPLGLQNIFFYCSVIKQFGNIPIIIKLVGPVQLYYSMRM